MSSVREYLDAWLRWRPGRQGTGYDKLLLIACPFPFPFDAYLLRYPVGAEIPGHRDPVESGRHYRLNIVVREAGGGGQFICADPIFATARIKLFRPDRSEHGVTRVERRARYVLSIGWVLGRQRA
jgi:hypothetical protein